MPNLNYKNEFVDKIMGNGDKNRVQDRVHDGVQDHNKVINDIAENVIGQVTTIGLLEYCKLPSTTNIK